MTIDPRKLTPGELTRLLASTPLGEVIGERQLYRHRSRAGYRIGDARHVDLPVRSMAITGKSQNGPQTAPGRHLTCFLLGVAWKG